MADVIDRANDYQQVILDQQISAARSRPGISALYCEDCGSEISVERRSALPGVIRCISCQTTLEQKSKHYRG